MTEGSCLCGATRFSVAAFMGGVFKCHCSRCQKAFGGASSAAVLCAEGDFAWLAGEGAIREFRLETGFLRRFCPQCGGIVPQHLPDYRAYWIPAGLLDSEAGLTLRRHIHVASKAHWEKIDEATPRLAEGFE